MGDVERKQKTADRVAEIPDSICKYYILPIRSAPRDSVWLQAMDARAIFGARRIYRRSKLPIESRERRTPDFPHTDGPKSEGAR